MRTTRHLVARLAALVFALLLAAPTVTAAPVTRSSAQAAPAATKDAFTRKSDTAPKARERGSINVTELAAQPKKTHKQMAKPRGTLPKRSGTTTAPRAATTNIAPLVLTPSTANAAPTPIQQNPLPGLASGGGFTNVEPADPWVAVGPDHVVQFVNTGVRIQNRQGVLSATDTSTFDFFFLPTTVPTFNSDGRVIYDSLHARWIATEVSWDCSPHDDFDGLSLLGRGYLDFAISTTADPTGDWDIYYVPFNDSFPDYPAAGTSTDKVALTSNVFPIVDGDCGLGTLQGTEIDVMDWAKILAPGGLNPATDVDGFVSDNTISTPRAAVQVPA
ncbi:MAG TPA: hypothetical protein VKA85_03415, partial [Candidatus Limnocylindrales bacterium]|nr:hypothetical protein [Candidatus Limnocylindrales bacterium]